MTAVAAQVHTIMRDSIPQSVICVLGGAPDTGNLGVSALGIATMLNLAALLPGCQQVIQGWSSVPDYLFPTGDRGLINSTRLALHQAEGVRSRQGSGRMRMYSKLDNMTRGFISPMLQAVSSTYRALRQATAILELAGGDSFSDIYGPLEFNIIADLDRLALEFGKPLVYMPQTIGPFCDTATRELACQLLNQASLIATREMNGLEELKVLLGREHPNAVFCPDVAFSLPPVPLAPEQHPKLLQSEHGRPVIGLNISGLLYHRERHFGIATDYPQLIDAMVEWILRETDAILLLIPHVRPEDSALYRVGPSTPIMDMPDSIACGNLYDRLVGRYSDRVCWVDHPIGVCETKHLMSDCAMVIGARMHACIGAISLAVPTVTLAYSKKAAGVMGVLGEAAPVIDLRSVDIESAMRTIQATWNQRHAIGQMLRDRMPGVLKQINIFFQQKLTKVLAFPNVIYGKDC